MTDEAPVTLPAGAVHALSLVLADALRHAAQMEGSACSAAFQLTQQLGLRPGPAPDAAAITAALRQLAVQPAAGEILAAAEDERHTLLTQAAREHLSRMRAEARRYEEELAHIESVFALRLLPVPEVPAWITSARKADIETARWMISYASDADLAAWLAKTSVPGPGISRDALHRDLTAGLTDQARVYGAWIAARQILQVSGHGAG